MMPASESASTRLPITSVRVIAVAVAVEVAATAAAVVAAGAAQDPAWRRPSARVMRKPTRARDRAVGAEALRGDDRQPRLRPVEEGVVVPLDGRGPAGQARRRDPARISGPRRRTATPGRRRDGPGRSRRRRRRAADPRRPGAGRPNSRGFSARRAASGLRGSERSIVCSGSIWSERDDVADVADEADAVEPLADAEPAEAAELTRAPSRSVSVVTTLSLGASCASRRRDGGRRAQHAGLRRQRPLVQQRAVDAAAGAVAGDAPLLVPKAWTTVHEPPLAIALLTGASSGREVSYAPGWRRRACRRSRRWSRRSTAARRSRPARGCARGRSSAPSAGRGRSRSPGGDLLHAAAWRVAIRPLRRLRTR